MTSEMILLGVLIVVCGLLIWERSSSTRERTLLRSESATERRDLMNRLARAMGKAIPPLIQGPNEWAYTAVQPPVQSAPAEPTPPPQPPESPYPLSGALSEEEQEFARLMQERGAADDDIWATIVHRRKAAG